MERDSQTVAIGGLQSDVEIFCTNLERSRRFYCDVLGLTVVHSMPDALRLDGGDGRWLTLWRVNPLDETGMNEVGRHTGATFALAALGEAYEILSSEGVQFVSRPCWQPWGHVMVNLVDPDGNVLTLLQRRPDVRDWSANTQMDDAAA
ncbi:MAG: VOC family protein [Alphaproteobacteria bacterium]|nr:VOC family protein [Rhodospirillaceae bacterium]MBT6511155.1 VOC family protein [Rhodospirillaceae bacterium]MBT7614039.1 VOC family protein [Rhodospirillaceae bacterium]MBT7649111.1 VOC family protein [Rhodospirillaceae bacterium]MDG2482335.1 VOC family protein [Alphaproteobacteria bacterium]